jgi:pimeloyl-ACP methyl ester carboxylesterase
MRIAVRDVKLFFDADGPKHVPEGAFLRERPTALIVHTGPGADHTPCREHLGPALRDVGQVLYVDLRGHPRSDRSTAEHWNLDTWAEDLAALLEAIDLDRVVLVAVGWGTFAGIRFAARNPERISRAVLVNPVTRFVPARVVAAFDTLDPAAGEAAHAYFSDPNDQTVPEFLRLCFPLLVPGAASIRMLPAPLWNLQLASHWYRGESDSADMSAELARFAWPTLVIAGEADAQSPLMSILEAVDALPGRLVELRRYPEARHSPMRDAPESLEAVREFVAR